MAGAVHCSRFKQIRAQQRFNVWIAAEWQCKAVWWAPIHDFAWPRALLCDFVCLRACMWVWVCVCVSSATHGAMLIVRACVSGLCGGCGLSVPFALEGPSRCQTFIVSLSFLEWEVFSGIPILHDITIYYLTWCLIDSVNCCDEFWPRARRTTSAQDGHWMPMSIRRAMGLQLRLAFAERDAIAAYLQTSGWVW